MTGLTEKELESVKIVLGDSLPYELLMRDAAARLGALMSLRIEGDRGRREPWRGCDGLSGRTFHLGCNLRTGNRGWRRDCFGACAGLAGPKAVRRTASSHNRGQRMKRSEARKRMRVAAAAAAALVGEAALSSELLNRC